MLMGMLAQIHRRINPYLVLAVLLVGPCNSAWVLNEANGDGPPISFSLSLSVGRSPSALVVTDFDRDGRRDLAVANSEGDSVSLLFGSGPANFSPAISLAGVAGPIALAAVDLNADQREDLIVASGIDDIMVSFRSIAPNRVEKFGEVPAGTGPAGVACPDLNEDGRPDLVVSNSFEGTISVYFGGARGFEFVGSLITGSGLDSGPLGVATGDFNHDGAEDVVVANQLEDTIAVFFGDGTGAFPVVRSFEVDSLPTAARIADVTGDGVADVVSVNEGSDTVVILVGDGAGNAVERITLETGGFPESVAARDLNGDGAPDLVTADSFSDVVSVFASQGQGQFAPRITFPVGRSPFDIAIGDFNSDGRPDLATANLDDDTVSILLNTTPYEVVHGDVDGDGRLSASDAAAMIAELFDGDGDLVTAVEGGRHAGVWTTDANLDGFATSADLLRFGREYSGARTANRRTWLTSGRPRF